MKSANAKCKYAFIDATLELIIKNLKNRTKNSKQKFEKNEKVLLNVFSVRIECPLEWRIFNNLLSWISLKTINLSRDIVGSKIAEERLLLNVKKVK